MYKLECKMKKNGFPKEMTLEECRITFKCAQDFIKCANCLCLEIIKEVK